jgi:hypothetical protein
MVNILLTVLRVRAEYKRAERHSAEQNVKLLTLHSVELSML